MPVKKSSPTKERSNDNLVVVDTEKAIQQLPIGSKISLEVERDDSLHEKYKSVFLGYQPGVGLLFKMPCSNQVKHSILLRENNIVTVRGLSTQGNGAIVAFRATITRHYQPPYPMLLTTLPENVQMHLLRNEPRFNLDIHAEISSKDQTFRGGLEDISLSGCCFGFQKEHNFCVNDRVEMKLGKENGYYKLDAIVKNIRLNEGIHYLGLTFVQSSLVDVNLMLQDMILKGAKQL